jgi:hypothetical protein
MEAETAELPYISLLQWSCRESKSFTLEMVKTIHLRRKVLLAPHTSALTATSIHETIAVAGAARVYGLLSRTNYWPGMHKDLTQFEWLWVSTWECFSRWSAAYHDISQRRVLLSDGTPSRSSPQDQWKYQPHLYRLAFQSLASPRVSPGCAWSVGCPILKVRLHWQASNCWGTELYLHKVGDEVYLSQIPKVGMLIQD